MDVRLERAYEPELRRWFARDPARFGEFRRRYAAEILRHGRRS